MIEVVYPVHPVNPVQKMEILLLSNVMNVPHGNGLSASLVPSNRHAIRQQVVAAGHRPSLAFGLLIQQSAGATPRDDAG